MKRFALVLVLLASCGERAPVVASWRNEENYYLVLALERWHELVPCSRAVYENPPIGVLWELSDEEGR
jgi:hypothetical protein